jgi:hypothetical protein
MRYPSAKAAACPELWLNGQGFLAETAFPTAREWEARPYSVVDLSEVSKTALSMQYVGAIESVRQPAYDRGSLYHHWTDGSFYGMRKALRDRDWDWSSQERC